MQARISRKNIKRASRKTRLVARRDNSHLRKNANHGSQEFAGGDNSQLRKTVEYIQQKNAGRNNCNVRKSAGLKYLESLFKQVKYGICLRPLTKQAVEFCQKFKVSLATGYRHAKRGTTPATERRIGCDGKRYPAGTGGRSIGPVERELRLARQALNRADDKGCSNGITQNDLSVLHEILRLAKDAVVRWQGVLP